MIFGEKIYAKKCMIFVQNLNRNKLLDFTKYTFTVQF